MVYKFELNCICNRDLVQHYVQNENRIWAQLQVEGAVANKSLTTV
jgi:hypothetical protein